MKKILVFASGSKEGGGSGFQKLAEAARQGTLGGTIVGVVSNHEHGGVRERAEKLDTPFIHFPAPWTAEAYQRIATESGADFFALSGWLKLVCGLDPATPFNSRTVVNIHPALLPEFGGPGVYGSHAHEIVMEAYRRGETDCSGVSMHFVTPEYDRGPVFFRKRVPIMPDDTPETLGKRVNAAEHEWQPRITDLIVRGLITWDGKDPSTLVVPAYVPRE